MTLLTDTTDVNGAGAVQDTYTLLRKGIRKLIKTMGYHLPGKRQGCSADIERLISTYVDQDRRAVADWSDPAVDRSAFQVDLDAKTATCPNGQTVSASSTTDAKAAPATNSPSSEPSA